MRKFPQIEFWVREFELNLNIFWPSHVLSHIPEEMLKLVKLNSIFTNYN